MSLLESRGRAFEAHFAYKEEMAFTAAAYRNRQLAVWAGGLMGLHGQALDAYVAEVTRSALNGSAFDPCVKVCKDLAAKAIDVTSDEVKSRFEDLNRESLRRAAA
jgi:hypothetical protein